MHLWIHTESTISTLDSSWSIVFISEWMVHFSSMSMYNNNNNNNNNNIIIIYIYTCVCLHDFSWFFYIWDGPCSIIYLQVMYYLVLTLKNPPSASNHGTRSSSWEKWYPDVGIDLMSDQWEFQDPKMEVLYHIRPYFLGISPYIGLI